MMDINFMVVFGSGFVGGCGISFAFYTFFANLKGYKKDIARKPEKHIQTVMAEMAVHRSTRNTEKHVSVRLCDPCHIQPSKPWPRQ
jgi:hypothetical protein